MRNQNSKQVREMKIDKHADNQHGRKTEADRIIPSQT